MKYTYEYNKMMKYTCEAMDCTGVMFVLVVEANGFDEALKIVREHGYFVVKIVPELIPCDAMPIMKIRNAEPLSLKIRYCFVALAVVNLILALCCLLQNNKVLVVVSLTFQFIVFCCNYYCFKKIN